ncbi:MAG: hypothetical protein IKD86_02705 [Firmicutes bacterium]|nr:hypothetical protein [Bacillota bacterium]
MDHAAVSSILPDDISEITYQSLLPAGRAGDGIIDRVVPDDKTQFIFRNRDRRVSAADLAQVIKRKLRQLLDGSEGR